MKRCVHAAPCLTCFIYWESDQVEVSELGEFYLPEEEELSDEELEMLMYEEEVA
jgi:hypothetical protein